MSTVLVPGQRSWSMTRDKEGHREYKIKHLVEGTTLDGPASALLTPGLPLPGSVWIFDSDADLYAFCKMDATVTPVVEDEPNTFWEVEQTFSTKPDTKRCQEQQFEDPLLEPPKVSGGFIKFTEEATEDRFGLPLLNSAWEQYRGPQVEFDANRPTVKIEMNVATFTQVSIALAMIDHVNDAVLWGFPARCIKLSNVSWERKFYGTCNVYYTLNLEFDINANTFDRRLLDEGTKALHGKNLNGEWIVLPIADFSAGVSSEMPDYLNPLHFVRYKDAHGENARVILNGVGLPYDISNTGTDDDEIGSKLVQKYEEANFILLGIPLVF